VLTVAKLQLQTGIIKQTTILSKVGSHDTCCALLELDVFN